MAQRRGPASTPPPQSSDPHVWLTRADLAALRAATDSGDLVTVQQMGGTMAKYASFGADDLADRYSIAVRAVVKHRRRGAERVWLESR